IDEGVRDGVVDGQTFDGLDVAALRIDGEDGARVDALAAEDDGASSTGAAVADLLRAGVVQVIAQGGEQRDARLAGEVDGFAVDVEGNGDGAGSHDIGGGGRGLGFPFEEACSHSARSDAYAA